MKISDENKTPVVTNNLLKILQFKRDIFSQLQTAKTAESFLEKALRMVNKLGFSDLDIMQITTTAPHVNFIASTLPKSIFEIYLQEEMYRHDVVLDVLMRTSRPIHRSNIYEYIFNAPFASFKFDENRAINELWLSYGYNNCYCMPLTIHDVDARFVVSVLRKDITQAEFKHQVNEQRIRLKEFNSVVNELLPKCKFITAKKDAATLQPGDAEILKTFCILGTAQQVADHLNLELTTVNNKITRIKKMLGACSIASAVYIAIKEGLIIP